MAADEPPSQDGLDRLAEIVDVVVGIASNDFSRRARVGDGSDLLDGLAAGINMLAEEVGAQLARERAFQEQMRRTDRLAAIGQLAAGVAHEINNPAAFVLANLHALADVLAVDLAGASPALRAAVEQARLITRANVAGLERIATIVSDLKNFSRREAEEFGPVLVSGIIDDACRLVRAELIYRARLEIAQPLSELRVRGNPVKLTQVLTNLLFNAAQAIPEGAPADHAVTVTVTADDREVRISVSDTGSGLAPEARARLFEPFFTTKPRDQGTGLGLAISADLVRQHGGELTLAETSSRGTTFAIRLPRERTVPVAVTPLAPGAGTGETAVPPPSGPRRRPRILLVDDEPMLLDSWRRLFSRDYDLVTALGGLEAIRHLEADGAWDVIVCDLMMPDLDGADVLDWLTRVRPDLVDRTLFISGGAFTPRGNAFADALGDRLLQKPLRPGDFRTAVARIVGLES